MASKPSNPQDVLTLHIDTKHKYMAHFFHFINDTPIMTTIKGKDVYTVKRGKLSLSDIDAILKRHTDLKERKSIEDIAVGVLPVDLLDSLELSKLDIEAVIKWAKAEATAQLATVTKTAKVPKAPADPKFLTLVKMLIEMQPREFPQKQPLELRQALIDLINNTELLDMAVAKLATLRWDDKANRLMLRDRKK